MSFIERFRKKEIVPDAQMVLSLPDWPKLGMIKEPFSVSSTDHLYDFVIDEYGGEKFGNWFHRSISMHVYGTRHTSSLIMRASESVSPKGLMQYQIDLDALTDDHDILLCRQVFYDKNGQLNITHGRTGNGFALYLYANRPELSPEDRNALLHNERTVLENRGLRKLTNFPPQIDVRRTAASILHQVKDLDFSRPVLHVL